MHGFSQEPVLVSAYVGSAKNLKDLKDVSMPLNCLMVLEQSRQLRQSPSFLRGATLFANYGGLQPGSVVGSLL